MKLKDTQFTVVHPFYNDGDDRFPIQFEVWKSYPDWVWDHIKIVLIDDHSTPPLLSHFPTENEFNFDLKIYRIKQDLNYNLPGAWNLGFHVADTEWVFAMDSDHRMLKEDMVKLVAEGELNPEYYYQIRRNRITYMENLSAKHGTASGSWLVCKRLWEKIGGFDEELAGYAHNSWGWWEHDFNRRLKLVVDVHLVRAADNTNLHLMIQEHLPDSFGKQVWDIHPDSTANRERYRAKVVNKAEHPTDMLRFDWELVYKQERT